MSEKIYGDRDLMAMDISGNHYCRHVDHMTRESLHSKSDIAAELGWRDMQIAALQQKLDAVLAENVVLKESREVLAKNALETCKEVYCAGYRNTALHDGLMQSTGNRNIYPNPIRVMVDEAINQLKTPATDAILNDVRAEAIRDFWNDSLADVGHVLGEIGAYQDASEAAVIVHDELRERVEDFAAHLRAETDTTSSQYESLAGGK
ncbi:hypothetical protein [Pantoea eucrina]|uniref:hypothetical protein n=1 Tax=Pantoea eucrina TaxID=472693 RepID=UPI001CC60159|nr:hypothetical protein [Pantoea eucrina]UBB12398.1 hypothetical protein LAC65_11230 [Pantoea eucrina]